MFTKPCRRRKPKRGNETSAAHAKRMVATARNVAGGKVAWCTVREFDPWCVAIQWLLRKNREEGVVSVRSVTKGRPYWTCLCGIFPVALTLFTSFRDWYSPWCFFLSCPTMLLFDRFVFIAPEALHVVQQQPTCSWTPRDLQQQNSTATYACSSPAHHYRFCNSSGALAGSRRDTVRWFPWLPHLYWEW